MEMGALEKLYEHYDRIGQCHQGECLSSESLMEVNTENLEFGRCKNNWNRKHYEMIS